MNEAVYSLQSSSVNVAAKLNIFLMLSQVPVLYVLMYKNLK